LATDARKARLAFGVSLAIEAPEPAREHDLVAGTLH
jgi:hypothetical protein